MREERERHKGRERADGGRRGEERKRKRVGVRGQERWGEWERKRRE